MKPVKRTIRFKVNLLSGNFSTNFGKDNTIKEISGSVTKLNTPYDNCTVSLYNQITMDLISICKPTSDGRYRFLGFHSDTKYFVLALDSNKQYNAVVQDNIFPK